MIIKEYNKIYEVKSDTDTSEFKSWFGQSKIKDSNGKPLVCYHASKNKSFNSFQSIKPNFFTYDKSYASRYKQGKGKLYAVYLRIEKPFSTKNDKECLDIYNTLFLDYTNNFYDKDRYYKLSSDEEIPFIALDTFFSFLRKNNRMGSLKYDGVYVDEGSVNSAIVPLYPNQIKSAYDNDGSYDINDDNIYS